MTRLLSLSSLTVLFLLMGCSSSKPGGANLYEAGESPVLLDSEIRMNSLRRLKGDSLSDLRIIKVENGQISCSLKSPSRGMEGEGTLTIEEYARIWQMIEQNGGFNQKLEAPDPKGGYYHAISFRLGNRKGETSAQNRTNFLGLGTTEIQARLSLANEITRSIEENCSLQPIAEKAGNPVSK